MRFRLRDSKPEMNGSDWIEDEIDQTVSSTEPKFAQDSSHHPRRVLCVSPLGTSCEEYQEYWAGRGFFVLPALNAAEALPLLRSTCFDFVVLAEENTTEDKIAILNLVQQLRIPVITRNRYRPAPKIA